MLAGREASIDGPELRQRVVAAVDGGGMSRRGAATRFGVAVSTAVK
jgi:transposase